MTSKSMNLEYLKRSASQEGMMRKAIRLGSQKAEEKKITRFQIICGPKNPLKLLVGDWHKPTLAIPQLFCLSVSCSTCACTNNKKKDSIRSQEGWIKCMGEKKGRLARKEGKKKSMKKVQLNVLLQNGISNTSEKDQAYKKLLDIYNHERSQSPASNVSSLSIMEKL